MQVLSPSAEYCQMACSQLPQCELFTFFTKDYKNTTARFYCSLRQKLPLGLLALTDSKATSGYPLRDCGGPVNTCDKTLYADLNFTGSDYGLNLTGTAESCQQACTSNRFCNFFTFIPK
ncbi:coagulation factor XI-like [Protopterus annectens]|uniref:coagulation factor XI-like n=1 Tax=Protopterus annectens TaxID=7888 RepID=UPI001CF9AE47|nr:coagulation factor XI-like [Protopterus annectens]